MGLGACHFSFAAFTEDSFLHFWWKKLENLLPKRKRWPEYFFFHFKFNFFHFFLFFFHFRLYFQFPQQRPSIHTTTSCNNIRKTNYSIHSISLFCFPFKKHSKWFQKKCFFFCSSFLCFSFCQSFGSPQSLCSI